MASAEANLVAGIPFANVEWDLRRGDGDELKTKFRAVHSSAALAVNTFGIFKNRPNDVVLFDEVGARAVEFERTFRIFRRGRAPHMDVWIDRGARQVAVESKLLEYVTPKRASFAIAYERLAPPVCELKHYFGLNRYQQEHPSVSLTLLYIFWEPLNWRDVEECTRHREEVQTFAAALSGAKIAFRWMTYNELWEQWAAQPLLAEHAASLKARYQICL